jgi:hypothetical protein
MFVFDKQFLLVDLAFRPIISKTREGAEQLLHFHFL